MPYRSDRAQRLGRLIDQLRAAEYPSVELISSVGRECDRILTSRQSLRAARISSLIAAGAWTEAVLALMEAELPLWKLRRLVYDDGRWYCAISRQRELPDWLDQAVESDHPNLSLAVLKVFVEALLQSAESTKVSVPAVRSKDEQYNALDCDNFA